MNFRTIIFVLLVFFGTCVNCRNLGFFGAAKEDDADMVDRETRTNPNNTMNHILDQIHRGHVTSHSMSHWMDELQHMYDKGQIDQDDLHSFMDQMHEGLANTPYEGACCPFGK